MSDAPKKKAAALARLPRGFVDRDAADIRAVNEMTAKIREVYELYGFDPVETPAFRISPTRSASSCPIRTARTRASSRFQDDDEQWMSLRYDLTAPLARYVAENFDALPASPTAPIAPATSSATRSPAPAASASSCSSTPTRWGSASPGRCRNLHDGPTRWKRLGIKRGDYVVKVNNRKVLDGVLSSIGGIADDDSVRRLAVLRAIDKLDKFGLDGVRLLLGPGRRDESGDFTKGADISEKRIDGILSFLSLSESFSRMSPEQQGKHSLFDLMEGYFEPGSAGAIGLSELREIDAIVRSSSYGRDRISIETSVVRGLEYYTGPVYEVELTFPVTNDEGQVVRFGSVAGGGRYDGLVARFRGEEVPATGFSIGVSRLAAALKSLGKLGAEKPVGPVVVLVMDRDRIADYQQMVSELRSAGIRAEMYLGSSGMKPQMKYADRRNAPAVIIQGSNEREAGEVMIKDLVAGAEAAKTITDNAEWRAARPAQFAVKRGEMVEKIRELLAGR
jgi:histidyl-tRNA synthetase